MKKLLSLLILIFLFTACTPAGRQTLTVMTHDSFAVSDELLAGFEEQYEVEVEILLAGDAGTMLNSAILAKGAPLADVLYGVDNTYLSRALEEQIFETYDSPLLAVVPDEFELDPAHGALPIDYGDVCLNYEIAYFEENGLPVPASLEDLLEPEYAGLLTVENPASSSPGLAFLLATIGHFGTDGYLEYWSGLVDNGVSVVNDWETAYYTEFSQWGGPDPLVVSYGSSPPFEVIFAEEPIDAPPTAVITADGSCFRQVEFAGILAGTENRDLAEAWIDFMLSVPFQEDIPLNMFVFPVNPEAELQAEFVDFLAIPDNPVRLDPAQIAANRETWLQAWTETVLR
jgi:thiamine transport system substrate-binding protein